MSPVEMRQRAEQYRKMALVIDDLRAHTALLELARQYEAQSETAEAADKSQYGEDGGESR
jgi:hypothetical protein